MNMYTVPKYRRRGIAYQTLDKLVKEAKDKEILPYLWKPQIWDVLCMKNMDL